MVRSLVFDATAPDFAQQWQRPDWQLLQNSSVHRFRGDDEMNQEVTGLAKIDYVIHQFDAGNWLHEDDVHIALMAELNFPDYYGRNLDALNDAFRGVAEYRYGSDPRATGTVLALRQYESFASRNSTLAFTFLDLFAINARFGLLVGHPMLCLISATSEFPAVGATPVILSPTPMDDRT